MPRVSQRQKNKPFKTKSKGLADRKKNKASTKTKTIVKPKGRVKNTRAKLINSAKQKKTAQVDKIASKNAHLDQMTKSAVIQQLKNETEVKIIVLFPANKDANSHRLIQQIYKTYQNTFGISLKTNLKAIPYPSLQISPSGKTFLKNKLIIISGERNNKDKNNTTSKDLESLIDIIKCADIICPVLSCRSTNIQGMQLNPHGQGGAFDEIGYTVLNMIRSMGTPATIGVVQDLNLHQLKHHDKIERLFKRFFNSELGEHDRINYLKGNQHQLNKLLRQMDTTTPTQQPWKDQRGYMLIEDITTDEKSGNLTFHGYLKGNCVNANQLVHLTGFQDYQIQKIQITPQRYQSPNNMSAEMNKNLVQYSTCPQSLLCFSKAQQVSDDILSGLNNLKLQQKNRKDEMEQQSNSGFEDQSDDQQNSIEADQYFKNNKQEQKTKRIQLQMRKQDQLEFEDEVEYAAEQILREKYKSYQGLKNFKTSQWNQLQNLPDEYDRIYTFKHYTRTHQSVLEQNDSKGFAYPNFYISVTIRGLKQAQIVEHCMTYPIILSFLLKHERKMTQLHAKVRRNPYYLNNETFIQSNQYYTISLAFRRFIVRPIFSRIVTGTEKTKFTKKIDEDYESYFYCSFYYYNYFPPAPIQIYRVNQLNLHEKQSSPIMYGTLAKCDPLQIILERIILTGYPFKINKRKSTVRFMFFNPKDVKYFKPVQVRSKMGLRGRIEESLGTHGYMKVLFNDKIKHNDTVCMHLYRRVFPQPNF